MARNSHKKAEATQDKPGGKPNSRIVDGREPTMNDVFLAVQDIQRRYEFYFGEEGVVHKRMGHIESDLDWIKKKFQNGLNTKLHKHDLDIADLKKGAAAHVAVTVTKINNRTKVVIAALAAAIFLCGSAVGDYINFLIKLL